MMKRLSGLILMLVMLAMSVQGASSTRLYGFLTFTNLPTQYNAFVVNGQTLWWVTNVTTNATQVLITNTTAGLRTNLYAQAVAYPFTNNVEVQYGTNSTQLVFFAQRAMPLSLTLTGGWGYVTYKTNTTYGAETVAAEETGVSENSLTNMGSTIVRMLEKSTNALSETNTALSQYASLTQTQSMANKTISDSALEGGTIGASTAVEMAKVIVDADRPGYIIFKASGVTNANIRSSPNGSGPGLYDGAPGSATPLLVGSSPDDPEVLLNYYSAVRLFPNLTEGVTIGTNVWNIKNWWFGTNNIFWEGMQANNAIFVNVILTNAAGAFSGLTVTNLQALAGTLSDMFGLRLTISNAPVIQVTNLQALSGYFADGFLSRVVVSNASVITVTNLQAQAATLGSAVVTNGLTATNGVFAGTNDWRGDLALVWATVATAGDSNNLAFPIGTNVNVKISGSPTAAFNICGIAGGRDGRELYLANDTGFDMTLSQTTLDPEPRNRIVGNVSGDLTIASGGWAYLKWKPNDSRWHFTVATTSATNTVGTIRTNGVAVSAAATVLNVIAGTNMSVSRTTNTAGVVDMQIDGPTIPTIPTAFAYDRTQISTNGGTITITNGAQVTNLFLKPLSASTPALTTTNASGQTASIVEHRESNGALIGGVTNGVQFMSISNAAVIYPACYRVFTQTAESTVTNITTSTNSLFGAGAGSLVLTQNFWQVGRTLEVKLRGQQWTGGTPGNSIFMCNLELASGNPQTLATNIYAMNANLVNEIFEVSLTLTCRTNSSIGYVECDGVVTSTSTGSDAQRYKRLKNTGLIFDTTAAAVMNVAMTNGATTTSFRTQTATVTLYP